MLNTETQVRPEAKIIKALIEAAQEVGKGNVLATDNRINDIRTWSKQADITLT